MVPLKAPSLEYCLISSITSSDSAPPFARSSFPPRLDGIGTCIGPWGKHHPILMISCPVRPINCVFSLHTLYSPVPILYHTAGRLVACYTAHTISSFHYLSVPIDKIGQDASVISIDPPTHPPPSLTQFQVHIGVFVCVHMKYVYLYVWSIYICIAS